MSEVKINQFYMTTGGTEVRIISALAEDEFIAEAFSKRHGCFICQITAKDLVLDETSK